MDKNKKKVLKRIRRQGRVTVKGTQERPRLSVYRSLKHIYAQVIDDTTGKTLVSAKDIELGASKGKNKTDIAFEVGKLVADKAQKAKITTIVFDKGGFKYTGRVKSLADGARQGGLHF